MDSYLIGMKSSEKMPLIESQDSNDIKSNFKEYYELEGYYIKFIYTNKDFSIIAYDMNLFDGKKYITKLKLKNIQKTYGIFKEYETTEKIFHRIIEVIDKKKHYNILNQDNLVYFKIYIDNYNNESEEISFKLSKSESNEKDEYINILINLIKQLRSQKNIRELTKDNKSELNKNDEISNNFD